MKRVLLLLLVTPILAMDLPKKTNIVVYEPEKNIPIYIKTSDGIISIARWQIDMMPDLLNIFQQQPRVLNNANNPIYIPKINVRELKLLSNALDNISLGKFQDFYSSLVEEDKKQLELKHSKLLVPEAILSLENGNIRTLINAANKVNAHEISAFCLSYLLPSELQKAQIFPYLVDFIMKIFSLDRVVLQGHFQATYAIALSTDGTKMASASQGRYNNLILWDISNVLEITPQILIGHQYDVQAVAFSPDGKKVISGGYGEHNNLILWDISNPHAITHQALVGHPSDVRTVAFSSDGKKIVSACGGNHNNIILWDISNPLKITHQVLVGHPSEINVVAFSSDGKKIVSACGGNHNNLILWDISNPLKITHQVLVGHPNSVEAVAFSSDNKKIISGCLGGQNNLILWDCSNVMAIIHKMLVGHADSVHTVAFNSDGKKIVSGGAGHDNLRLWDMSDPHQIKSKILKIDSDNVLSVTFSRDNSKIIATSWDTHNNLVIYKLLLNQEKQIFEECTISQLLFIYQLCVALARNFNINIISPYAQTMFNSLPDIIKNLLLKELNINEKECIDSPEYKPRSCVIF